MDLPRIRQLVFASAETEDIERLRHILDLGEGFVDPGVSVFGLTNGVFALGDQFLEVVVPVKTDTAAGRFLSRSQGEGGYMAIFQTDDLSRVRAYADRDGIRRVWDIDVEDISATHFHPADIGAAIVSVDEARPPSSWRWGGPNWESQAREGGLVQLEVSALRPEDLAVKWGALLGVTPHSIGYDMWELALGDGAVQIVPGPRDFLKGYALKHPNPSECLKRAAECGLKAADQSFRFAGVEITVVAN